MININGKTWNKLSGKDIEEFLSSPETEESFFFEFKEDRVGPRKLSEEISALSNTYGGYIFLGVSDSKTISGCSSWHEQRIVSTIHDSITPTPSFDIKKFIHDGRVYYVIKIDEGIEPPYITKDGKILERLSSSSCIVRDSSRLAQMYSKNERQLKQMEDKIAITPVLEEVNNVYGYIDMGFIMVVSDAEIPIKLFNEVDLKTIIEEEKPASGYNLLRIGNSYFYALGGIETEKHKLPAHLNNFLEIMYDGSARMRVLLFNRDPKSTTVNMIYPFHCLNSFRMIYTKVMAKLFPDSFVYAKKYESLTVLKQFQPVFYFDSSMIAVDPSLAEKNKKLISSIREKQAILGVDNVITNDRIPKNGLYIVNKYTMQRNGIDNYTVDAITGELFYSQFANIGFPFKPDK